MNMSTVMRSIVCSCWLVAVSLSPAQAGVLTTSAIRNTAGANPPNCSVVYTGASSVTASIAIYDAAGTLVVSQAAVSIPPNTVQAITAPTDVDGYNWCKVEFSGSGKYIRSNIRDLDNGQSSDGREK